MPLLPMDQRLPELSGGSDGRKGPEETSPIGLHRRGFSVRAGGLLPSRRTPQRRLFPLFRGVGYGPPTAAGKNALLVSICGGGTSGRGFYAVSVGRKDLRISRYPEQSPLYPTMASALSAHSDRRSPPGEIPLVWVHGALASVFPPLSSHGGFSLRKTVSLTELPARNRSA